MAARLPATDLGTGWAFPVEFREAGGTVRMASGLEDIRQSLLILLSTAPGERVMLPDYGCDLTRFVFQALTPALAEALRELVSVAIRRWEQRIDLLACDASIDPDEPALLLIELHYRVRESGATATYVHPLHLGGEVLRLEEL
jgi:phage baseplate assembly protein W